MAQSAAQGVLNAFRHQRTRNNAALKVYPASGGTCSTPFGINERGTRKPDAYAVWDDDECSTPFGINERGTSSKDLDD